MQETRVQSLDLEDPMEKEMATHSSILAGEIPWTEEPGGHSPWSCKEFTIERLTLRQADCVVKILLFISGTTDVPLCSLKSKWID